MNSRCDFAEETYNSVEYNKNEVSETMSNCSLGNGPDQVLVNVFRTVSNNLSVHFLKLVQHIISTCEHSECLKLIDIKPLQSRCQSIKLPLCFERLLFSKLCPIVESQNFNDQHSCLKLKSKSTQLPVQLKLLQDTFENKDIYTLNLEPSTEHVIVNF